MCFSSAGHGDIQDHLICPDHPFSVYFVIMTGWLYSTSSLTYCFWPQSTSDLWRDDSVVGKSLWNVRFCSWWRLFMSNINCPVVYPALLSCTLKQRDRESGLFIYSFIYASSIHVTTSCWRAHSLISTLFKPAWLEFTGQTHPPTRENRCKKWGTSFELQL